MAAPDDGSQRLFIALPCPLTPPIDKLLAELRIVQQDAAAGLRVVDANTLHVTLSFLGTVSSEHVTDVHAAMAELHDRPAPQLTLAGAGHFANALWLGVRMNPELAALQQHCEAALRERGFALEERSFRPHVTIARLKRRAGFDRKAWCELQRDLQWAEYGAPALHLYRSELRPEGSRYSVIHSIALR